MRIWMRLVRPLTFRAECISAVAVEAVTLIQDCNACFRLCRQRAGREAGAGQRVSYGRQLGSIAAHQSVIGVRCAVCMGAGGLVLARFQQ